MSLRSSLLLLAGALAQPQGVTREILDHDQFR